VSLTNEALQPVQKPAGSYPALHGRPLPKKKRETLMGNVQEELSQLWKRYDSGWYHASKIPERLALKDIIEDQGRRLFEMVKEMNNEFGALIIRYGKEVELAFFQVGKAHEIDLAPTRPLREDEWILGTIHGHPTRDYPSTTDVYTFLRFWEGIGIVLGAEGTIYLMIKTNKTIKPTISLEEFDKKYKTGLNTPDIAKDYNFLLYLGKINEELLKLKVGDSQIKESSLQDLLKDMKGMKSVQHEVKKVPKYK